MRSEPFPPTHSQAFARRGPDGEAAGVAAVASAGGVAGVLYTASVHPVSDGLENVLPLLPLSLIHI